MILRGGSRMQCWRCGQQTPNPDKICDACAKEAIPAPIDRKSMIFRPKPREPIVPIGTAIQLSLMVVAGVLIWYWLGIKEPLVYQVAGNDITISSSKSSITYGAQGPIRVSGRVLDSDTPKMRLEGGAISSFVFFLAEDDYIKMENDYRKKGRCPASFLNQHSKAVALIGGSEAEAEKLRNIALKEGDRLTIEGQSLSFRDGTYRGMPLRFSIGKAQIMHPTLLKVN